MGHKVRKVLMERSLEHLQDPLVTQAIKGFKEIKAKLVIQESQDIQVSHITLYHLKE